jgi:hypothetical protein
MLFAFYPCENDAFLAKEVPALGKERMACGDVDF